MTRKEAAAPKTRQSIARNLTVSLVATSLLVILLATVAFTLVQVEQKKRDLRTTSNEIVELAAQSLSLPLWFLHTETIQEIGRAYAVNPMVVGLRIHNSKGTEIYAYEAAELAEDDVRLSREITHKGKQLGRLQIAVSAREMQEDIKRMLVLGAVLSGLESLALLVITGAWLRVFLGRPIRRLEQVVAGYSGGVLDSDPASLPTEFAPLEDTLRGMAGRLRSQVQDLALAEARYRSLFENALEGMFRVSLDGRLLNANPAMVRMLGYDSLQELAERTTREENAIIVDPADKKYFFDTVQREGRAMDFETELRRKDGSTFIVRAEGMLIENEGEIQGNCQDVTHQVEARQTLIHAKEAAEATSQLKSDFLAMVSHELRTPLTSVLGYSKLIGRQLAKVDAHGQEDTCGPSSQPAEKIRAHLDVIVKEGERLTRLINNVLDLAKLEAGRMEMDFKPCDVNTLLRASKDATRGLFEERGGTCSLDMAPDLPPVSADPDRMQQVVINLLANAVRFADGDVECRSELREGRIVVQVLDRGPGISPDMASRVFTKFRQLGDTVSDPLAGTGLGLAICREIVECHQGEIWFENREDGGCAFCFSLPLAA